MFIINMIGIRSLGLMTKEFYKQTYWHTSFLENLTQHNLLDRDQIGTSITPIFIQKIAIITTAKLQQLLTPIDN